MQQQIFDHETYSTDQQQYDRQNEIEKLQEMRDVTNDMFSLLHVRVEDQEDGIKKLNKDVSSTLANGLGAVKELTQAKKNEYGTWKSIVYGIGGGVVAGVAGLAAAVPLSAAAAGGVVVAGGGSLLYSNHKKKICNRELNRLQTLRDKINANYEQLFTPDCTFPEDDLDCDNDAVKTQRELLRQGEYLSCIRYQLLDAYAILAAKTALEIELSYPELEKYELQHIKCYKTNAKDDITSVNKEAILDGIGHNVEQDRKIAENVSMILPRQVAACIEIEQKMAEALKVLEKKNKEVKEKLEEM